MYILNKTNTWFCIFKYLFTQVLMEYFEPEYYDNTGQCG